jgi:hypothetical protein
MFSRSIPYKAETSRQGSGAAAVLGIFLAVYVGIALCFYWLMQPTVVTNQGLAAFRAPPNTIVSSFLVPSAPSGSLATTVEQPAPEIAETPVAPPKKAVAKREARAVPRPQRPVREHERERSNPSWGYASSQPQGSWGYASSQQGSRPWF